ncbi:MAG TPA: ATP-binding protein [Acidimicrobiales bacterium]|nr:ATP-binding protein [Acidimicrobiales bacterium]
MTADDRPAVLLVDDRTENLMALEAVLAPLDVTILQAGSGDDALRHLLSRDVSVILLDVQMPNLDGFETAARIKERERTRDTPIIFLTAISAEHEHVLRGYSTGALDYLSKPVDPDILRAKVSAFVELDSKTRQLERQGEALAAKTLDLERVNGELEQFAYVASHDLQEPLRLVCGYLELLGEPEQGTLGPEEREYVRRALAAAERMSVLIRDLLALSTAGTRPPPTATTDLSKALTTALENLAVALTERGASVEAGLLPDVRGDADELVRVFQNLVGNAVKFAGDRPPTIRVWAERRTGEWEVCVADDGVGMRTEDTDRVFGMFERLDRDRSAGTGLGLALCRKIIERHGGRIWLESAPGEGTTVHLTVPAAGGGG